MSDFDVYSSLVTFSFSQDFRYVMVATNISLQQ